MNELRAFNLPLKELDGAVFFKGEKEFEPHYVITKKNERVSRVNVWGIVVKKFESENNFASISIDDFTNVMNVNAFEGSLELLKKVDLGDAVKVIGKMRENDSGLYILAEGVKKLSFKQEMLKRLQNIEFIARRPEKKEKKPKKEKNKAKKDGKGGKEGFEEFKQASELSVEREVIK